ncbi:hypothetical protein N7532_010036 [Penicillium argentinense]|uniref:Uncharacterized protein n=1 Tax=Penicillium argentinense TaxID=1131581 RepID=A0A9W9EP04_9EURO|nr:uncharacterized protein N7532_010036 [Penicillium argentinense]KAJ5085265.1 hypothetical protein N7532_010036 [Penicillium argentinense]
MAACSRLCDGSGVTTKKAVDPTILETDLVLDYSDHYDYDYNHHPCTDASVTITTSGKPPGSTTIPAVTSWGTETVIITTGENTSPVSTACGTATVVTPKSCPQPPAHPGLPRHLPGHSKNPQVGYFVGYTREVKGGIVVDANNYPLVYSGFYGAPTTDEYTFCGSVHIADYFYLGDGPAFDCRDGTPDPDATALNEGG